MKNLIDTLLGDSPQALHGVDYSTLVDFPRITELFISKRGEYTSSQPFPHAVIDDFLPESTLQLLLDQYPLDQDRKEWIHSAPNLREVQTEKRHLRDVLAMPKVYRELIWELGSSHFLDALTMLSGIRRLISDPELQGAGIHQISRGGFLKIHADFSTHRKFDLARRINFLLYLNPDWQESWGGHLELWDQDMQGPPVRILPKLNRCVIFSTTANSFHGHPYPLQCPDGVHRKSIALYYYTNGRPDGEAEPTFATTWREVPSSYQQSS
ncbi:2OG-Fe(II) oxygenase [Aquipseudomonas alcaligenes]|uniref:2OG-Fe(II) oxygenase n=1 Tax=Aquipseudomonas alcaligenes TaxID=43263 RepID=UPI00223BDB3B|nr:2OG-Fe(II) oxygenase [Pseudomonas alcaligenes]